MDPIEKAIRGALDRGNVEDSAFRRRIYASAEQALVRSLQAKAGMTAHEQSQRVMHLRHVAAGIETEFQPAMAPVVTPPARQQQTPQPAAPGRNPGTRREPGFGPAPDAEDLRSTKSNGQTASGMTEVEAAGERKRRGRLFNRLAGLFVVLTLFALAVMLAWAVWTSGLLNTHERASNQSGSQGVTSQGEDAANWITVFQPTDISSVTVSEGVTAELQGTGKEAFLRLLGQKGANGGQASFEFGRGILESLQGKKIVIDISASTSEGGNAEIAVTCDLAGMGQCLRTRFQLDGQVKDNLIIVQLSDQGPEASGILNIMPDLSGTGLPVDIRSIRVRVES